MPFPHGYPHGMGITGADMNYAQVVGRELKFEGHSHGA